MTQGCNIQAAITCSYFIIEYCHYNLSVISFLQNVHKTGKPPALYECIYVYRIQPLPATVMCNVKPHRYDHNIPTLNILCHRGSPLLDTSPKFRHWLKACRIVRALIPSMSKKC